MEEKLLEKLNILRNGRVYKNIVNILFPALIILMAFWKVNKGIDITDSTYSPTNFLNLDKLDGMWFFSTFYANLLGGLFVKLPGGSLLLGINIYTSLIKAALALFAYYFFFIEAGVEKELSFVGVLVSVALCWCPTTILYNYLTYLLFFFGAAFLYMGLTKKKAVYLVLAGFFLGSNVFVRLPNLCEASLIVAVWLYSAVNNEDFKECFKKTWQCVLGYLLAFVPGVLAVCLTRGFSEYVIGIKELFGMTEESTSYSPIEMVLSVGRQYVETWKFTEIAVFALLIGWLVFLVLPAKLTWLRYVATTVTTGIFFVLLFVKGIMPLNFHWYAPIYRFGAMILSFVIVSLILACLHRKNTIEQKLLAVITLIVIAVTPIGSNNDIYSNLNNMFFVLPVFLFFLVRFVHSNEHFRGVRYSLLLLTMIFFASSILFGLTFTFRDGLDKNGQGLDLDSKVTSVNALKGMKTTGENVARLEELSRYYSDKELSEKDVLLYGDVCGLSFFLEAPLAIETAWPTLASYSTDKFEASVNTLTGDVENGVKELPVVIVDNGEYNEVFGTSQNRKQEILKEFLDKYSYSVTYSNDVFSVMTCE